MIPFRRIVALTAGVVVLVASAGPEAAGAAEPAPASSAAVTPPVLTSRVAVAAQVLASGLSIPWGIAALPDGSALVTERDTGKIWQVGPGRAAKVVYTVSETRPGGEGGLLGIAVGPHFSSTKKVFIYYTTASDNRVAVFRYGSTARPSPIVTGIPKGTIHNGGGLVYKPNRGLMIGTGDTGDKSLPQNSGSLGGKILRVTSTGAAASGNRWGKILTKGHRNVQDLTLDPEGDRVWATELGQDSQDELNHIVGGANYGWPVCEGKCSRSPYRDPAWTWAPSEASPSGITFVRTPSGPRFDVGALRGQRVWSFSISQASGTVTGMSPKLVGTYGRIRGVQGRGDGTLWITTSNGGGTDRVIRLIPSP